MKKSKLAISLILSISLSTMAPADTVLAAGTPESVNIQKQKASASQIAENESETLANNNKDKISNNNNTTDKKTT